MGHQLDPLNGKRYVDAALHGTNEEFQRSALAWLNAEFGFDGAVWGQGTPGDQAPVAFEDVLVEGRSPELIRDYLRVAHLDPVSRQFLANPFQPQHVLVEQSYRGQQQEPVREYLRQYCIGQLILAGARALPGEAVSWMTLYREDAAQPFSAEEVQRAAAMIQLMLVTLALRRPAAVEEPGLAPVTPPCGTFPSPLLSAREYEVARAYADGASYKAVARQLGMAPATARVHLASAFRKLDVHNKVELRVALTRQSG